MFFILFSPEIKSIRTPTCDNRNGKMEWYLLLYTTQQTLSIIEMYSKGYPLKEISKWSHPLKIKDDSVQWNSFPPVWNPHNVATNLKPHVCVHSNGFSPVWSHPNVPQKCWKILVTTPKSFTSEKIQKESNWWWSWSFWYTVPWVQWYGFSPVWNQPNEPVQFQRKVFAGIYNMMVSSL